MTLDDETGSPYVVWDDDETGSPYVVWDDDDEEDETPIRYGPPPPSEERLALTAFLVWLTDGHGMVLMEGNGYRYHEVAGDDDIAVLLDKYEGWQANQVVAASKVRYEQ